MAEKGTQKSGRPSLRKALHAVASDLDLPADSDYKRVDIRITGGGTVVYRLTPSDRGEQLGGAVVVS